MDFHAFSLLVDADEGMPERGGNAAAPPPFDETP
jgi:hypothetical protein